MRVRGEGRGAVGVGMGVRMRISMPTWERGEGARVRMRAKDALRWDQTWSFGRMGKG